MSLGRDELVALLRDRNDRRLEVAAVGEDLVEGVRGRGELIVTAVTMRERP